MTGSARTSVGNSRSPRAYSQRWGNVCGNGRVGSPYGDFSRRQAGQVQNSEGAWWFAASMKGVCQPAQLQGATQVENKPSGKTNVNFMN